MQINLNHSRAATDNLMEAIKLYSADVVLIQEPYTKQNRITGISRGHRTFSHGCNRVRTAILIANKKTDVILISQLSDEDAIVIEIIHGNLRFYAVSMYLDLGNDINKDLDKIENITSFTKGSALLIGMDSNARSKTWNDRITNARGRILEEYLCSKQLHIMNEECENTTFESITGKSNIDLTITNGVLMKKFNEWKCRSEESCSDHKFITFNIKFQETYKAEYNFHGVKYLIREEKLQEFREFLTSEFSQVLGNITTIDNTQELDNELSRMVNTESDTDKSVQQFEQALFTACKKCFRRLQPTQKMIGRKSVPWWTDELTILRKKTNALRRRYQKTKQNETLREQRKEQYYEGKRKYESTMKKEKIQSWKQYCTLTPSNNPWNAVYRLSAGKRRVNTQLTTLTKPDGTVTQGLQDTLNHMIDHFVPDDKNNDDTEYHKNIRTENNIPSSTQNDREFTYREILDIIKRMDPRKTPGEDGITSDILLKVIESFPKYIVEIYNSCLRSGTFPKQWKKAKIIPIVKPGKETSLEVTKYRPISLLNTGGKILEKLLIDRIMHHAHCQQLMNDKQFGFTPQKSTTDAAMTVKRFIKEHLEGGQSLVIVSLDVQGAFDAAWWPSIIKTLREFNCPKNLYHLAKNYFSQRSAVMTMYNLQIEKAVSKGCPQGSCCGPGFWNLQYNSLLEIEYTKNAHVVAFADDFLLITRGKSTLEAENYANVELKKIEKWAKNNQIRFNEQKTQALLITRKRRNNQQQINIYLNNKQVEQVEKIKYLGIIIDHNFNFNEHIQYTTERATKLINALSKAAKLDWGLKHQAMKTIYKGAILPLLSYAAPVWIEAINRKYNRIKFVRVQRLINIKIAKAFRTTSSEALCLITGLTPINLKLQEIAKEYEMLHQSSNLNIDTPLEYKKWPHPADIPKIQEASPNKIYTVEAYTDGSKTEQGVGAGVAIYMKNEIQYKLQFKLDMKCSNNQAEQLAISKALEKIKDIELQEGIQRNLALYTDSKVTLDSLHNSKNHNSLIEKIRQQIITLERQNWTVEIAWVKAHVGIRGNETADRLAKKATINNEAETYIKIPLSALRKSIREKTLEQWECEWQNTTKGAETKQYFPTVAQRLKQRFPITANITAMLTGHGRLKAYYHRFHLTDDPTCPCNEESQTTDHLLYRCSQFSQQREKLRMDIAKKGAAWPASKKDLITRFKKEYCTFVNAIDLQSI